MTRPAWMLTEAEEMQVVIDNHWHIVVCTREVAKAQAHKIGEYLDTVIENAPRGKRLAAVEHAIQELEGENP